MATSFSDALAKEQYDNEHPTNNGHTHSEHDKTLDLVHKTREVRNGALFFKSYYSFEPALSSSHQL